jgi:hypothetical protein
MRRLTTVTVLGLMTMAVLSGCSGSLNPKACVDTTALPSLTKSESGEAGTTPATAESAPAETSTARCGGFVFGISLGDRK